MSLGSAAKTTGPQYAMIMEPIAVAIPAWMRRAQHEEKQLCPWAPANAKTAQTTFLTARWKNGVFIGGPFFRDDFR
eukprot:5030135-Lingulodinium_polyedra.AAC.1